MWGLISTSPVQMPLGYGKEKKDHFLKEIAVLVLLTSPVDKIHLN